MTAPRFWRKINQRYRLVGTECRTCGTPFFPPRDLCPDCRRDGDVVGKEYSGEGEVVTKTVVHDAITDYDSDTPYTLAVVELDEGARVTAQIVDGKEDVEVGDRVEACFRRVSDEGEQGIVQYGTKFKRA
ncbi:MAG: Zn-ribbon domain-containing OB-fold protein [Halobacteriales archaeon]|nr:Zn-ribbon domain-containing OB-fold protein [Halobacteriales archaeon]